VSAPTLDDAALVAAHREGDAQAFGELVRRHGDRLWAVALGVLRNTDDAREAVQEALLTAFRRLDGYRGDAALSTWLHRILVNVCIDRIRRDHRRPAEPWPEHDVADRRPDPSHTAATRIDVVAALAALPEEQRIVIQLVDVEGHPVADAARLLDIPTGTVKSRCARGRLRLAELLGHLREEYR